MSTTAWVVALLVAGGSLGAYALLLGQETFCDLDSSGRSECEHRYIDPLTGYVLWTEYYVLEPGETSLEPSERPHNKA